jgi:tRNA 2-thiouridine synthesizing protein D
MKASIVIYSAPVASQAPYQALQFAKAWLNAGNHIERVFFYADAVWTANAGMASPSDEFNACDNWSIWATENNIDLVVCIAAALRRGIVDTAEAKRFNRSIHNLAAPFRLGGLGELVEMSLISDRLVSFGRHRA